MIVLQVKKYHPQIYIVSFRKSFRKAKKTQVDALILIFEGKAQSPDIGQISDGVFWFLDFWSIPYKNNYQNSRTSNDIDMKLGPVTKINKRNTTTSKKHDDDVILENFDVIVFFLVYSWFAAFRKLVSWRMVCKTYIFISSNLLSYKNWKQN